MRKFADIHRGAFNKVPEKWKSSRTHIDLRLMKYLKYVKVHRHTLGFEFLCPIFPRLL